MNVALMINSLGFGGAERIIADLSVHLEKRGLNVFVFVMDPSGIAYAYGGRIVPIGFVFKQNSPWMTLLSWQHLLGTMWAKRKYKIDVAISAMEYLNMMNLLTGKGGRVSTLHNYRFQCEVTPIAKDRLIERIFTRLVRRNSAIICVSRAIEEKAKRLYHNAVPIETIYNSIDVERIHTLRDEAPDDGLSVPLTDKTFVCAGRLAAQKAQDRLLRAFAMLHQEDPEVRLLLLGGGPDEAMLRELAHSLGIENAVFFCGFVSNPFYYIRRCRAFVLSSDYEGFGNVIVESLACGTPVISTDCRSGPREILSPDSPIDASTDGVELAPYGILTGLSEAPLAQAMRMLLTDDALHAQYTAKAEPRSLDFAIKKTIDQWVALIERIAS